MKVIKPQSLSLLTRVLDGPARPRVVVVVLGFFDFGRERLLREADMWTFAGAELGADVLLDECLPKTRGEVLISGHCFAVGGVATKASYVRASVGSVDKRVAVIGDRTWIDGQQSEPRPFVSMPISWERAFGGPAFSRNPAGRGYPPLPHMRSAFPLPNVETWGALVRGPADVPEPAGLRPIDPSWPQRARKAGTYDERWLKERFASFASDVDPSFFQSAPADQQVRRPWQGGEPFRFENMHPSRQVLEGRLPTVKARAFVERRTGTASDLSEVPLGADTVWLFPHAERGVLIFRGVLDVVEDDAADVETILLAYEEDSAPRDVEEYRRELQRRRDPERGFMYSLRDRGLVPDVHDDATVDSGRGAGAEGVAIGEPARRSAQRVGSVAREEALARARSALEAAGLKGDAYSPVQPVLPPTAEDLDSVLQLIEREETAQEERGRELEATRKDLETRAKRALEEEGAGDFDRIATDARRSAARPPQPRAAGDLSRLQTTAARLSADGVPARELEAKLESGELASLLQAADEAERAGYLRTAHLAERPERLVPEASWHVRARVLRAIATAEELRDLDLAGANLAGLDLRKAKLDGAHLTGVNLQAVKGMGCAARAAVLAHADLRDSDFEGADFSEANLGAAAFEGARFVRANLTGATLQGADLSGGDFSEAVLCDANAVGAKMSRASFRGASAPGLEFHKADLRGTTFAGADLTKATFLEADLTGVDFSDACLEQVTLVGCKVDGACFSRARLVGLRAVGGCTFEGSDFRGAALADAFLRGARAQGARLDGCALRGADLSECLLASANLSEVDAVGANLVRAELTGATLRRADLRDALISKADLRGADFSGANLFGADLSRLVLDTATKWTGANLKRARLWPRRTHVVR
jgi:uncharacterized protein YjbI with pentapeptide repeats